MSIQHTQLKYKSSIHDKENEGSISISFLLYLENKMDAETLELFQSDPLFELIEQTTRILDSTAFQDLVNLSLKYLLKPLDLVIKDFAEYYKNSN